jgi:hypothetical protein
MTEKDPNQAETEIGKKSLDKGASQVPISEQFYTPGGLSKILSWGDQIIPQPMMKWSI